MPSNVGIKQRALEVLAKLPVEQIPAPVRLLLMPARAAIEAASEEQIRYAAQIGSWLAWHAGRYVLEGDQDSQKQLFGTTQEEPHDG